EPRCRGVPFAGVARRRAGRKAASAGADRFGGDRRSEGAQRRHRSDQRHRDALRREGRRSRNLLVSERGRLGRAAGGVPSGGGQAPGMAGPRPVLQQRRAVLLVEHIHAGPRTRAVGLPL
ncbi:MAG: hypothetical protein AVDCRST_MAG04-892, partial [uncultured Acetobacteraceae bacterium]